MIPPAVVLGARGLTLGSFDALGPVVAHLESWRRETPVFCRHVGAAGLTAARPPALAARRDRLIVAWCEAQGDDGGAWAAALDWEEGAHGPAVRVAPGATRVTLAGDERSLTLFAADGEGVVSRRLGLRGGDVTLDGPLERHAQERRGGALLASAMVRGEPLAVFAFEGDEAWSVVVRRRGAFTTVRHALSGPIGDLRLAAGGGRAAVVLSERGAGTRFAVLGPDGRLVERPYPFFPAGTPALEGGHPVWVEDRWAVVAAASDELHGRLEREAPFALPTIPPPVAVVHRAKHLYCFGAEEGAVTLLRCDREGHAVQRRALPMSPADASDRAARQRIRALLAAVAERETAGYRDASRTALTRDGVALSLATSRGERRELRLEPVDGALRLRVLDRASGSSAGLLARAVGALGRWLRPSARRAAAELEGWATGLAEALDGSLVDVRLDGGGLTLELTRASLPEPGELARWWRRVREEHSTRRRAA